jgi:hypothetical protein
MMADLKDKELRSRVVTWLQTRSDTDSVNRNNTRHKKLTFCSAVWKKILCDGGVTPGQRVALVEYFIGVEAPTSGQISQEVLYYQAYNWIEKVAQANFPRVEVPSDETFFSNLDLAEISFEDCRQGIVNLFKTKGKNTNYAALYRYTPPAFQAIVERQIPSDVPAASPGLNRTSSAPERDCYMIGFYDKVNEEQKVSSSMCYLYNKQVVDITDGDIETECDHVFWQLPVARKGVFSTRSDGTDGITLDQMDAKVKCIRSLNKNKDQFWIVGCSIKDIFNVATSLEKNVSVLDLCMFIISVLFLHYSYYFQKSNICLIFKT